MAHGCRTSTSLASTIKQETGENKYTYKNWNKKMHGNVGTYEQHMERRPEIQLDGTNQKGANGIENKYVISCHKNIVIFFAFYSCSFHF